MKVSTPPAEAEAVAALLMSLAILSTFEEKRKSQTGKGLTNGEWPWLRQADALDAFMEDITAKAAEPTGDDTSVSKKACSILDLSKLAFWATVYGKIDSRGPCALFPGKALASWEDMPWLGTRDWSAHDGVFTRDVCASVCRHVSFRIMSRARSVEFERSRDLSV